MGWKSDWLYQLIFKQYELAWAKAQRDGEGHFGPASARLRVCQLPEIDLSSVPLCRGEATRCWLYDGTGWIIDDSSVPPAEPTLQGMFFSEARGRFAISEDRKSLVIEFSFGPRYGRGFQYMVRGQGPSAVLAVDPNGTSWCS